jgi:hypothetical protein
MVDQQSCWLHGGTSARFFYRQPSLKNPKRNIGPIKLAHLEIQKNTFAHYKRPSFLDRLGLILFQPRLPLEQQDFRIRGLENAFSSLWQDSETTMLVAFL